MEILDIKDACLHLRATALGGSWAMNQDWGDSDALQECKRGLEHREKRAGESRQRAPVGIQGHPWPMASVWCGCTQGEVIEKKVSYIGATLWPLGRLCKGV